MLIEERGKNVFSCLFYELEERWGDSEKKKQNCNKKNQKKLQQKKTSLYFYFTSFSFIHFSMAALVSGFTPRIAPLILVS